MCRSTNERKRAVLKFSGAVSRRVYLASFFEFERGFLQRGHHWPSTDQQQVFGLSQRRNEIVPPDRNRAIKVRRQCCKRRFKRIVSLPGADEIEHCNQAANKAFCRRNALLDTGADGPNPIGSLVHGRLGGIQDGECERPFATR